MHVLEELLHRIQTAKLNQHCSHPGFPNEIDFLDQDAEIEDRHETTTGLEEGDTSLLIPDLLGAQPLVRRGEFPGSELKQAVRIPLQEEVQLIQTCNILLQLSEVWLQFNEFKVRGYWFLIAHRIS